MHTHELTLGLAFGLGAIHALEPGHGKTAMLVYLSGERRSLLHPLVMGLSSALSHSLSLIGIAAVVHLTHHLVTGDHHHADESVTNAMRWLSAGIVIVVGLWMLRSAWLLKPAKCSCGSHKHQSHELHGDEDHKHADHHQDHVHDPVKVDDQTSLRTSYSMSALLGAAFGLMPCPSALAAYFTGLSSGSPLNAYIVIALFAAGIACSLTLVGMAVQLFGNKLTLGDSWLKQLPWSYIRAATVIVIGLIYVGFIVSR